MLVHKEVLRRWPLTADERPLLIRYCRVLVLPPFSLSSSISLYGYEHSFRYCNDRIDSLKSLFLSVEVACTCVRSRARHALSPNSVHRGRGACAKTRIERYFLSTPRLCKAVRYCSSLARSTSSARDFSVPHLGGAAAGQSSELRTSLRAGTWHSGARAGAGIRRRVRPRNVRGTRTPSSPRPAAVVAVRGHCAGPRGAARPGHGPGAVVWCPPVSPHLCAPDK